MIMMDRYTKAVLTIIAAALCVLALREVIPSATAFGQSDGGGVVGYFAKPCKLEVTIADPSAFQTETLPPGADPCHDLPPCALMVCASAASITAYGVWVCSAA